MSKKNCQIARQVGSPCERSLEQERISGIIETFEKSARELFWMAETITGDSSVAEHCLAETFELASAAQRGKQEEILHHVRCLMVHVAVNRMSDEIERILSRYGPAKAATRTHFRITGSERRRLRLIAAQEIVESFNALERVCFVVVTYLQYPVLDCALLLGCPCSWIESACERVFRKTVVLGLLAQHKLQGATVFGLQGEKGCRRN
jgi:DNA-directed RNA polymerase specialized sigma24 family protein